MERNNNQENFFNYLIKRYSKEKVLHVMTEVLGIKKGAAYKRLKGDTALMADEMIRIAARFGVSLDAAVENKHFLTFEYPFTEGGTVIDFLDSYTFFSKPLRNLQWESTFTYMANELPVFYYFSHHHIFTFLLAVWNHLHWDETTLMIKEQRSIDPRLEQLRNDLSNYFEAYPVTEIWNSNMLSNLYQQILFCVTIRAFEDKSFIRSLTSDISRLIKHLHELTGIGRQQSKYPKSKIYLNEFGNYQNLALYRSEKLTTTFIGFDMPHFIVSYSPAFYDFSAKWIEKIKRHSILISSEGYQFRELFFLKMNKDFEQFKDRLEKLVNVYYD